MNYKRIHDNIIEFAKNRILSGYQEKHHIIPKCLGGSNSKDNIVSLTFREHYLVHKLLTKIYPSVYALKFAFHRMSQSTNGNNQIRRNSYLYKNAREEFVIAQKALMAEKRNDPIYLQKLSKGISLGCQRPEVKQRKSEIMRERHNRVGYSKMIMTRAYNAIDKRKRDERIAQVSRQRFADPVKFERHSKAMKSFWSDPEIKEKQSLRIKLGQQKRKQNGIVNKIPDMVECPHCKKIGLPGWMGRWHFNNCKELK